MTAVALNAAAPSDDAAAAVLVEKRLVQWHLIAGFFFFLTSTLWGLLGSFQFLGAYPLEGISFFSFGRVRLLHTNEVAYGFLVNGFLGLLYYAIPRLTGRPVANARLGWLIWYVWQATTLLTSLGQLLGFGQAVEWGETPTGFKPGSFELNYVPIDLLIAVGALLVAWQFLTPIVRAVHQRMYVSLWYFSAGFVWLILTYVMGNVLPEWVMPGSSGGAVAGLFIHDLVGLFVTPMGWGLMYFFVPVILRRPVWSHALSTIGFWALAFFYPLNGVHHFLLSSIPDSVEYGAIVSTMAVELVVTTVVVNFFATMWGNGGALRVNLPIRYFYVGMIYYFLTCLQCAFQTTHAFQAKIHFTDWVPGHAHLVMLGVFAQWILGATMWLWPRLVGNEWWSRKLNGWHFWLTALGTMIMFLDLLSAGLVFGYMQDGLAPWLDIIRALVPFWVVRTFAGAMVVLAQLLFAWNLWKTATVKKPYDYRVDLVPAAA